ncbi:MAG TPA: lysylphosphatidylglycerol synthase transmembrane domain-containing protein [Acidimicrobiales bacterium]|nr:lysylphosphatidylglycerol synthase transmembrane domain-containing protein [Acidimicrobiales bacterium]
MGSRQRTITVMRVAASLVMLAVLVPRVELRSLFPRWDGGTVEWLAGALAVTFLGIVLSAVRWQRVLAALDLPARIGSLVSHQLAGVFVGNFLPSTIGGDVLRVSRLSASSGRGPDSFASVVLERLTGWLVLPVITLVALALNPALLRLGLASQAALAVSIGTLVLLGVVLVLASNPRLGARLEGHEGMRRFVHAVHLGLVRFRRNPGLAFEVLVAGFVYQLAVVLAAFLVGHALGLGVGWTAMMAFMPAVAILQVLPVTIGGLGVREGAFVLFLSRSGLGVTTEQAIALGLVLYGVNLLVSLAGAPAFAAGGRPARVAA